MKQKKIKKVNIKEANIKQLNENQNNKNKQNKYEEILHNYLHCICTKHNRNTDDLAYDPVFFVHYALDLYTAKIKNTDYNSSDQNRFNANISDGQTRKLILENIKRFENARFLDRQAEVKVKESKLVQEAKSKQESKLVQKTKFIHEIKLVQETAFKSMECIGFLSAFFAFGLRTSIMNFCSKLFTAVDCFTLVNSKSSSNNTVNNTNNNTNYNAINDTIDNAVKRTAKDIVKDNVSDFLHSESPTFDDIYNSIADAITDKKLYSTLNYRWLRNDFITVLLYVLRIFYLRYGSIQIFFSKGMTKQPFTDVQKSFVAELTSTFKAVVMQTNAHIPVRSIHFFFSNGKNTAMKRLQLFLKWMIRKEYPDIGLWDTIGQENLLYPLDTHVLRLTGYFATFLERKNGNELRYVMEETTQKGIEYLPLCLQKLYKIDKEDKPSRDVKKNNYNKDNKYNKDNESRKSNGRCENPERIDITRNNEENKNDKINQINKNNKSSNGNECDKSDYSNESRESSECDENNERNEIGASNSIVFKGTFADACAITEFYRRFSPDDPLKYDFPLIAANSHSKKTET